MTELTNLERYETDDQAERGETDNVIGNEVKDEANQLEGVEQSLGELKGTLNIASMPNGIVAEVSGFETEVSQLRSQLSALNSTDDDWSPEELEEAAALLARLEDGSINSRVEALELSANKALLEKYRDNVIEGYGNNVQQDFMAEVIGDDDADIAVAVEFSDQLVASVLRERDLVVDVFNAALNNAEDFSAIDLVKENFLDDFWENGTTFSDGVSYEGLASPLGQLEQVVPNVLVPAKAQLTAIDTELAKEVSAVPAEHKALYQALRDDLVQSRDFAVANLDGSLFNKEYYQEQFTAINIDTLNAAAQKQFALNRLFETARRLSVLNPDFIPPDDGGNADVNAYLNDNFMHLNGGTEFAIAADADAAAITAVADILQAGLAAEEVLLARRLEQQYSRRYRDDFVEFAARFDDGTILNAGPIARTRAVQERQMELFAVAEDGSPVKRSENPEDVDGVIGPDTLARAELLAAIRNPHVNHNGTAYVLKDGAPANAEINEEGVVTYASGVTCGLDGVFVKPEDGNIESMDEATGTLTYKNNVTRGLDGIYMQPSDTRIESVDPGTGVATYFNGVTQGLDGVYVAPAEPPEGFRSISTQQGFIRLTNSTLIELDGTRTIAYFEANNPGSIRPVDANGDDRASVARGVAGFDPSTGLLRITSHPYWAPGQYGPDDQLQTRPGISFEGGIVKVEESYELMNQNGITGAGNYNYNHSTGIFTEADEAEAEGEE